MGKLHIAVLGHKPNLIKGSIIDGTALEFDQVVLFFNWIVFILLFIDFF